jgi:CheY-like chemotaxis protein
VRGGFDVVVSDIGMPGKDGYAFIRDLRALPTDRGGRIPAIALTAFGTAKDRARALSAGYAAHVAKPVEPATLAGAIAHLAPRLENPDGKSRSKKSRN